MTIEIKVSDQLEDIEWDNFVAKTPFCHHEQISGFAKSRAKVYKVFRILLFDGHEIVGGSQIFILQTRIGKVAEIRHGPIFREVTTEWVNKFIEALSREAKKRNIIKVKVLTVGCDEVIEEALKRNQFVPSEFRSSIGSTSLVDITLAEDELLSRVKKKTRYNIRYAQKKGVKVIRGERCHITEFYEIHKNTAGYKDFPIFPIDYFHYLWDVYSKVNKIFILHAFKDSTPLGSLILMPYGDRLCSLWGSAARLKPDAKAGYLLDWEAILLAKEMGFKQYDLCGVETDYISSASEYKRGFGGTDYRYQDTLEHYYGFSPGLRRKLSNFLWDNQISRKIIKKILYRNHPRLPF